MRHWKMLGIVASLVLAVLLSLAGCGDDNGYRHDHDRDRDSVRHDGDRHDDRGGDSHQDRDKRGDR